MIEGLPYDDFIKFSDPTKTTFFHRFIVIQHFMCASRDNALASFDYCIASIFFGTITYFLGLKTDYYRSEISYWLARYGQLRTNYNLSGLTFSHIDPDNLRMNLYKLYSERKIRLEETIKIMN